MEDKEKLKLAFEVKEIWERMQEIDARITLLRSWAAEPLQKETVQRIRATLREQMQDSSAAEVENQVSTFLTLMNLHNESYYNASNYKKVIDLLSKERIRSTRDRAVWLWMLKRATEAYFAFNGNIPLVTRMTGTGEKLPSSEQAKARGYLQRLDRFRLDHADLQDPEEVLQGFILEELKRRPVKKLATVKKKPENEVESHGFLPQSLITDTLITAGVQDYEKAGAGAGIVKRENGKRKMEIKWENIDRLIGKNHVLLQKLLDRGLMELLEINEYRPKENSRILFEVSFSVSEFLSYYCGVISEKTDRAKAYETMKLYKKNIREELSNVLGINVTAAGYDGNNDGSGMVIIQDYDLDGDTVTISFGNKAARLLLWEPPTQTPRALFSVDNRNPNAYAIGRQMVIHYNMDKNQGKPWQNVLSVESLLSYAPNILSIQEVRERRQNWKTSIKRSLERALNELKDKKVILSWGYREEKSTKKLTPDKAASLSWEEFKRLRVAFECAPVDGNEERLERKKKRIEAARRKKESREIKIEAIRRSNREQKEEAMKA